MHPGQPEAPPKSDTICVGSNLLELVEDAFVEAFADAIGLRMSRLGSCMFNTRLCPSTTDNHAFQVYRSIPCRGLSAYG